MGNTISNHPARVTEASSTCIDHVVVNNNERICQSGVVESELSDHFITCCTGKVSREQVGMHNAVEVRSLKNYCSNTFTGKLGNLDLSIVLQCTEVGDAWNRFKTMFAQMVSEVAPRKETGIGSRAEKWTASEIV